MALWVGSVYWCCAWTRSGRMGLAWIVVLDSEVEQKKVVEEEVK